MAKNLEFAGIYDNKMLSSARNEYWFMVARVVGNIPLLYLLNKDWFHTLLFTTPGKLVCGICGMVILITALFRLRRKGRPLTKAETGLYGNTPMMRYVAGSDEPIYPIGFVQHKPPWTKKRKSNFYTAEGRRKFTTISE